MSHPTDQMQPRPSRRRVIAGAVWTTPVVLATSAAPVFAASPCATSAASGITWGTTSYSRTSFTQPQPTGPGSATGLATLTPAGQTLLTVNFSESHTGNYFLLNNGNVNNGFTLTNGGVFGGNGLDLVQYRVNGQAAQPPTVVTITFGRPVTNLTFPIQDITYQPVSGNATYQDSVSFAPAPTSFTPLASNMEGDGTTGNPFRQRSPRTVNGVNDTAASTTVTFAGPLTTLTMYYADTQENQPFHANQALRLGNFTFNVKPAGC